MAEHSGAFPMTTVEAVLCCAAVMELVVLIGLQASGKSTFVRERLASTHVHVSKDHFPNARNRDARQTRLIAEALRAQRSVVVDNTNPTAQVRAPLVALARQFEAEPVAYWFESELDACMARNAKREGRARVPDVALYATSRRLERPGAAEGFERIRVVRMVPGRGFDIAADGSSD